MGPCQVGNDNYSINVHPLCNACITAKNVRQRCAPMQVPFNIARDMVTEGNLLYPLTLLSLRHGSILYIYLEISYVQATFLCAMVDNSTQTIYFQ